MAPRLYTYLEATTGILSTPGTDSILATGDKPYQAVIRSVMMNVTDSALFGNTLALLLYEHDKSPHPRISFICGISWHIGMTPRLSADVFNMTLPLPPHSELVGSCAVGTGTIVVGGWWLSYPEGFTPNVPGNT